MAEAFTPDRYEVIFKKFTEDPAGADGAPMRMTGLETLFTHHLAGAIVSPPGTFGAAATNLTGSTTGVPSQTIPGNPALARWPLVNHANIAELDSFAPFVRTFQDLTRLHTEFVQFWRSVVRTSVVDFRGGNIEIPAFDAYDFYYEDGNGPDVSLSGYATQRIDLLVVNAMPIDETSAALGQYQTAGGSVEATPKIITEPTLSIVRGAGVGLKLSSGVDIATKEFGGNTPDPEMFKILANISDQTSTANFGLNDRDGTTIHGSFPSPDDLVNLTPNFLMTTDDSGDYGNRNLQQIGQTVIILLKLIS